MGSGKGKNRRAQAPSATSNPETTEHVAYDADKWREFTNSEGLWGMRVYDYYLGEGNDRYPTKKEYEKVMSELFQDAVDVGAFSLPSPYKAKDFVFQALTDVSRTEEQEIKISLKNKPNLLGSVFRHTIPENRGLDSDSVEWFMLSVFKAVDNIVSAHQSVT